jgi:hypothetical protein
MSAHKKIRGFGAAVCSESGIERALLVDHNGGYSDFSSEFLNKGKLCRLNPATSQSKLSRIFPQGGPS